MLMRMGWAEMEAASPHDDQGSKRHSRWKARCTHFLASLVVTLCAIGTLSPAAAGLNSQSQERNPMLRPLIESPQAAPYFLKALSYWYGVYPLFERYGWSLATVYEIVGPYTGTVSPLAKQVILELRPVDPLWNYRFTLFHEMGHMVDIECNTEADRATWVRVHGDDPTLPWYDDGSGTTGHANYPAETFATWWAWSVLIPGSIPTEYQPLLEAC